MDEEPGEGARLPLSGMEVEKMEDHLKKDVEKALQIANDIVRNADKRLFHYTIGLRIEKIIEDNEIKTTSALIEQGERPVAWFTFNPDWETTANKMIVNNDEILALNREETEKEGNGLFRIEIKPEKAPHTWNDYKRLSGIKPRIAKSLYQVAIDQKSKPSEWRVSFDPVTSEHWICIEKWNIDKWEIFEPVQKQ